MKGGPHEGPFSHENITSPVIREFRPDVGIKDSGLGIRDSKEFEVPSQTLHASAREWSAVDQRVQIFISAL